MRQVTLLGPGGAGLRCLVPGTPLERARGLLDRTYLDREEAMLFLRARSVHTFGMRFPIVVAHLDHGLRILGLRTVQPWRIVLPRRGTRHVLECASGTDLRVGDRLRVAPATRARNARERKATAAGP